MKRRFPEKICPRCYKSAYSIVKKETRFGYRLYNLNRYVQSWCRECVSIIQNVENEHLKIKRMKNKAVIFLISYSPILEMLRKIFLKQLTEKILRISSKQSRYD